MEGFLYKKGHVRRNWKERYFILKPQPPTIFYYEKKPKNVDKAEPLGTIPLHKGNIALDSERKDPLTFTIQSVQSDGEKKNFVVQAKTEQDMKKWIDAITKAAKDKSSQPPPSPKKAFRNPPGLSSSNVTQQGTELPGSASQERLRVGGDAPQADSKPGGGGDLYTTKFCFNGEVSHRNLLYEGRFANVLVMFANGKSVAAHDFILKIRCPQIYQVIEAKGKKKKTLVTLEWKDFDVELQNPMAVLQFALPFIYTDYIESAGIEMSLAVEMHKFADKMNIPKMKSFLEGWIEPRIDMTNVHQILKAAHDLQSENIKSMALGVAYANLKEFVGNKAATATLGMDVFHEVVALQTEDENDLSFYKAGEMPESTVVQDYKNLYISLQTDPNEGDAFVVLNGETIKFHKAILDGHSKGLADSLSTLTKDNIDIDTTSLFSLPPDTPPDVFRTILKFVYYGERIKSPKLATLSLIFAKRMLMHDFQTMVEEKMQTLNPENIINVLTVTNQETGATSAELYQKSLSYFVDVLPEVDLAPLETCDRQILLDIIAQCKTHLSSSPSSSSSSSSSSTPPESSEVAKNPSSLSPYPPAPLTPSPSPPTKPTPPSTTKPTAKPTPPSKRNPAPPPPTEAAPLPPSSASSPNPPPPTPLPCDKPTGPPVPSRPVRRFRGEQQQ